MNDSQVVEVVQPPVGLQCLQLILSPKGLGTALVTVYDVGLAPQLEASSVVYNLFLLCAFNLKVLSMRSLLLLHGILCHSVLCRSSYGKLI